MEYPAIEKALNIIRIRLGISSQERYLVPSDTALENSCSEVDLKIFPWEKLKDIAITEGEKLFQLAKYNAKRSTFSPPNSLYLLQITELLPKRGTYIRKIIELEGKLKVLHKVLTTCLISHLKWYAFNHIKKYCERRLLIKNNLIVRSRILSENSFIRIKFNQEFNQHFTSRLGKNSLATLFSKFQIKRRALVRWLAFVFDH